MKTIGIVDTMFARGNMGGLAIKTIKENTNQVKIIRKTVPGIKDLAVICKQLIVKEKCDIVIALGMPGKADKDQVCANQASMGIMQVQVDTMIPIIEVFVHEDEGKDDGHLTEIMVDRTVKHAKNALDMLFNPEKLTEKAGTGQRQGGPNASQLKLY